MQDKKSMSNKRFKEAIEVLQRTTEEDSKFHIEKEHQPLIIAALMVTDAIDGLVSALFRISTRESGEADRRKNRTPPTY